MDTILVVGVESVVGANVAASLAEHCRVVGLTPSAGVAVEGCETAHVRSDDPETVRHWIASVRPAWVVHCGPAARSSWQEFDAAALSARAVDAARHWASAAATWNCRFTLVSSDAVFAGPWMFHREDCTNHCPSAPARTIRSLEAAVLEACPSALVARTNAFGWGPAGQPGIGRTLAALEANWTGGIDGAGFATPILATDLASILEKAWRAGLEGIFHIAGAERVSGSRFIARLALEFGLPVPRAASAGAPASRTNGPGGVERSLDTRKARQALRIAMPLLADGLERLRQQAENGYPERLHAPVPLPEKVA